MPVGLGSLRAKLGPGLGSVRQSFKVAIRELEKLQLQEWFATWGRKGRNGATKGFLKSKFQCG